MVHVMIMAGGIGTRFWPLSHPLCPKQFLSLISNKPLIVETIERVKPLTENLTTLWILGNVLHQEKLKSLPYPLPQDQILEEPFGKNTAPCIGWAAMEALKKDPDATLVILPSDHWITPQEGFIETINTAIKLVSHENCLVTIGINPTFAHTGYGYIQTEDTSGSSKKVISFTEKPSKEVAEVYLKKGNYFWNSGIFVWKASKIISLFKEHLPQHFEILQKLNTLLWGSKEFNDLYNTFEPISIDYGIMEKASTLTKMVPAQFDWSDIGSWTALENFLKKDTNNNASNTEVFTIDSNNNIIYSEHGKVILFDIHDKVVVNTNDTLLIFPKSQDQNLKKVISHIDG